MNRQRLFLAVTHDLQLDVRADRGRRHPVAQLADALDVLAVKFDNHIATLHPRLQCRTVLVHVAHQRAPLLLHLERLGQIRGDLLDAHAQPSANHLSSLDQTV